MGETVEKIYCYLALVVTVVAVIIAVDVAVANNV